MQPVDSVLSFSRSYCPLSMVHTTQLSFHRISATTVAYRRPASSSLGQIRTFLPVTGVPVSAQGRCRATGSYGKSKPTVLSFFTVSNTQ
jgi:hypothetical protein